MKKFVYLFLLISLFISNFNSPIRAQEYRLGKDDVLKITVYREEELDRTVRVSSDGYISFPLLGKVKAEGLTVSELERSLILELIKYLKNPQVTVFIEEFGTITVSGQVEKSGSYPLKGELTVIEAISLAGGFTKIAAKNSVKIMRIEDDKKKTIIVRVADINKSGDKSKDVSLKRGDIIFVPESLF
jgi:polysaccharide export outer membrane protein